jgi:hypothetical protein
LRSEPQIETMFKLAMRASKFFEDIIRGVAVGLSRPHAQKFLDTRFLGMSAEHRVISRSRWD